MTVSIFGYGQASYDPLVPSTERQEAIVRDGSMLLISDGRLPTDSVWAGFVRDEVTPKPVKFRQRQAGSMLLAGLGPGDILMASSYDRIFANVADAWDTLELARRIGFRLIVLAPGVDTGTPQELLSPSSLPAMMKSLRQLERRRTKEEFAYRRGNGMPAGGKCPIGWQMVRASVQGLDRAYFVPDPGARRVAQFIAEHYDRWGGTFEQTAYWLNAQKIFRPDGRRWRRTAIFNWYHAAKDGFPLPNGRREAFPIPVDAMPVRQCRTIAADDA